MFITQIFDEGDRGRRNVKALRRHVSRAVAAGHRDEYTPFLDSVEKQLTDVLETIRRTRRCSRKQEKAIVNWSRGVDNVAKKLLAHRSSIG